MKKYKTLIKEIFKDLNRRVILCLQVERLNIITMSLLLKYMCVCVIYVNMYVFGKKWYIFIYIHKLNLFYDLFYNFGKESHIHVYVGKMATVTFVTHHSLQTKTKFCQNHLFGNQCFRNKRIHDRRYLVIFSILSQNPLGEGAWEINFPSGKQIHLHILI